MCSMKAGYGITIIAGLVFAMYLLAVMQGWEQYASYVLMVVSMCGFLGAAEISHKFPTREYGVLSAMLGLYSLAGFLLGFQYVLGGT